MVKKDRRDKFTWKPGDLEFSKDKKSSTKKPKITLVGVKK